jgi:hypothetical protein
VALRKSYQWVKESARCFEPYPLKPWSGSRSFESGAEDATFVLRDPSFAVCTLEAVLGIRGRRRSSRQLGMEMDDSFWFVGTLNSPAELFLAAFGEAHDRAENAGSNKLFVAHAGGKRSCSNCKLIMTCATSVTGSLDIFQGEHAADRTSSPE